MQNSLLRTVVFGSAVFPSLLKAHDDTPSLPFQPIHAHDGLTGHLHFGYESRYYIEGRDGLNGDSILSTTLELGYEHLALGAWYGISPEQNYDELQLSASFTWHWGDFDYYFSWTHFQFSNFFPNNQQDNDLGIGLSYAELPWEIELSFDAYYSIGANGSFMLLSLAREFELSEKLSAGIGGSFGVNQGYVSNGSDGVNHLSLESSLDYLVSESVTLSLHTTYSWALDRDPMSPGDQNLIDFFHAGVALQLNF